jgi:hypothetical protein
MKALLTKERLKGLLGRIRFDPNPMAFIIYLVIILYSDARGRITLGHVTMDRLGGLPMNVISFGFKEALFGALTGQQLQIFRKLLGAESELQFDFDRQQKETISRWHATKLRDQLESVRGKPPYRVSIDRVAEIVLGYIHGAEKR